MMRPSSLKFKFNQRQSLIHMLRQIKYWLKSKFKAPKGKKIVPRTFARAEHSFSRKKISQYALKVLYRLHHAGYEAYLVGGGVRDVLLGLNPKDFDIATNGRPEEVAALFQNSRLIGRRFRLVHVHFGRNIVEVATFRRAPSADFIEAVEEKTHSGHALSRTRADGMIIRDNIYGTLEDDIFRRDFTINAIYYNISDFTLIDYVGGIEDLKSQCIRIIGDPLVRYREDPVRMLRALRFAAKLNFKIHPDTEKPIFQLKELIRNVPAARLFDEYLKLFLSGHSEASFRLLRHYGFISILFPSLDKLFIQAETKPWISLFLQLAFKNTDERIREDKAVSSHFLLAALLWYPIVEEMNRSVEEGLSAPAAFHMAFQTIFEEQRKCFSIPRRLTQIVKEISSLQFRLKKRTQKTVILLYTHPRFRAAYDFLVLRAEAKDPEALDLAQWWTHYINADETARLGMTETLSRPTRRRHRKRNVNQP